MIQAKGYAAKKANEKLVLWNLITIYRLKLRIVAFAILIWHKSTMNGLRVFSR